MSMASDYGTSEHQDPEQPADEDEDPDFFLSPGGSLRRVSGRPDHLQALIQNRRQSVRYVSEMLHPDRKGRGGDEAHDLTESQMEKIQEDTAFLKHADTVMGELRKHFPLKNNQVEIRIQDFSYCVKDNPSSAKIQTVYNQSVIYGLSKWIKRVRKGEKKPKVETKFVLQKINLVLNPGKMYLVLGPPASGKTSLLKAVAGRLPVSNGEKLEGSVLYNDLSLQDKAAYHVQNAISYIDQLDFHAPRMTVFETFDFAFQCKSGGTHAAKGTIKSDAARDFVKRLDKEKVRVELNLEGLGLVNVKDTFVGNSEVRGVSGGQRRRVTIGEMFGSATPVFCGDEISTGLDAASTYDICLGLMHYTRLHRMTRVISLLQPSPETVSLFDEIILLAEGRQIYVGPVDTVEDYFANLGYICPDHVDVADFLQMLATPDGVSFFRPSEDGKNTRSSAYTVEELADIFEHSQRSERLIQQLNEPWETKWEGKKNTSLVGKLTMAMLKAKYRNSPSRMIWLNFMRFLLIWFRDKRFLFANTVKNLIMGVSVGGVFFDTDSVASIYGVMFQITLFIMLGSMVAIPEQVSDRIIYYKHADANFYGPYSYAIGLALSLVPQALIDVSIFGTIIYWMVGLDATAPSFFIFIAILFAFAVVMNQMLGIFAAFAKTKAEVQGYSSVILLFQILFCGFIVAPTVIPGYYSWLYWWNPLAWVFRALLVNEFQSGKYSQQYLDTDITVGELILISGGQVHNGEPFGSEWVGYAFAYLMPYAVLCTLVTGFLLANVRAESAQAVAEKSETEITGEDDEQVQDGADVDIPFMPVDLSFENVCYDVKASKGKETLRLLTNVSGVFKSGRMTALMGSSGAGKTTLMDVIALRKTSGILTGDIRLNGFEQEQVSFRRSSGYVEQFDVQAAELTVRETVLFSARLRLATSDEQVRQTYVDKVLSTLELLPLADSLVGREGEGGLSFEQRKRVSIAVELAASPSVIFLDEPTSGLDSRAALIVVKALRKIADSGRTVVATIHQPSSAVFDMFDDLLLLKKGGRTVFFGELGDESNKLVKYFEGLGADPIGHGENPANWMLSVITSEKTDLDFAEEFLTSEECQTIMSNLRELVDTRDPEMEIKFEETFATSKKTQQVLANQRLRTIYWRSPAYNLARMVISLVIAFILGSVFVTNRNPAQYTEQEMTSVLSTVFISFIIIGVLAINSVLPVMLEIRDLFYRHRAAGMLSDLPVAVALGVAEKWFILLSSFLFCVIFIPMMGFNLTSVGRSFAYWGFFTFNTALYSYFGQLFVCSVRGMKTAQILASVYIGINNFFSGLIVRPQYLSGIFKISYWITPGHYVYEGLVMTQFYDDETPVSANQGSAFFEYLVEQGDCADTADECVGTVSQFVVNFFGGEFDRDHIVVDAIILGGILLLTRVLTFYALKYFNYTST